MDREAGDAIEEAGWIEGTCTSFCGAAEAALRLNAGLLSDCEEGGVLVAAYTRSAAGTTLSRDSVRTSDTLSRVVRYLLGPVLAREDVGEHVRYEFVADRLRAARVEAAVQRVATLEWLRCVVAAVRFHATAAYIHAGIPGLSVAAAAAGGSAEGWWSASSPSARSQGGYDEPANEQRLGDALGRGLGVGDAVWRSLSERQGSLREEAAALLLELWAAQLLVSVTDPGAAAAALRDGGRCARRLPANSDARGTWTATVAVARARARSQPYALLRAVHALCSWDGAVDGGRVQPARLALRCLAHRLLPPARAALLVALSAAMPPARPLPLPVTAKLLHFHGHSNARGCPGCTRAMEGEETSGLLRAGVEESPAFCAARLCMQLKLAVHGPPEEGGATEPWASTHVLSRIASWRAAGGSTCGLESAALAAGGVVFDKVRGAALAEALAAMALPIRVALAPLREDGCVPAPSWATVAPGLLPQAASMQA
jgi:hypothetical protein